MNLRRAALLALAAFAPGCAMAADPSFYRYSPPPSGTSDTYIVTIGANVAAIPSFPGSDKVTGAIYPSVSFRRSDEPARFTAPDDGASISVLENPNFRFGPVFRYQSGRDRHDDRDLVGLRKLKYDVEGGLFFEYWPTTFLRARLEARHGIRSDSGFVGNAGIDFIVPYGRQWTFSIGPRLAFGDDDWANRYFGISASEAIANTRVFPYRASGGITSLGALGSATYAWNDQWATTGYAGYDRLVGSVSDSPIVRRIGSADQFIVGAKVTYSFSWKPSFSLKPFF